MYTDRNFGFRCVAWEARWLCMIVCAIVKLQQLGVKMQTRILCNARRHNNRFIGRLIEKPIVRRGY